MNPVLGIIGNMLGGSGKSNNVAGSAQANSFGNLNSILNLFGVLKGSVDPSSAIQEMAKTNPQIKQAMDYINANGGDAQSAFYKLANQNGIDPNKILNMIK